MNKEMNFHVIKDPVHGTMQFTNVENNWIKPFIDSPNFQRLRHIKQLGMGDFIFPGAVHTRFNHCIGCCYIASQIARKIGLAEEERQLVMIACLLHDIGHGPFSHAFEDVFHDRLIRHEMWTPFFLADYRKSDFFKHYVQRNPRHPVTEEKLFMIEEMIMHKSRVKRLLADIVSSQLDADRLDYLLRDSHFCGVTYGTYDLRWMLNSMVIVDSKQGERLGITHKGIGVVEHYLMARRLMTRNIYHNQKKLALEFLLIRLLSSLAENLSHYSVFANIKTTQLGKFLIAADEFNQRVSTTNNINDLKQQFLEENYSTYKELCDYDVFSVVKLLAQMDDNHAAAQIAKRLQHRHIPKIIRIEHVDLKTMEQEVNHFKLAQQNTIQDWQFNLIKTPHQSYSAEDDPILIMNEKGLIQPLNEMSLIINAISGKPEHSAFLCIDSDIVHHKQVEKFVKSIAAREANLTMEG